MFATEWNDPFVSKETIMKFIFVASAFALMALSAIPANATTKTTCSFGSDSWNNQSSLSSTSEGTGKSCTTTRTNNT